MDENGRRIAVPTIICGTYIFTCIYGHSESAPTKRLQIVLGIGRNNSEKKSAALYARLKFYILKVKCTFESDQFFLRETIPTTAAASAVNVTAAAGKASPVFGEPLFAAAFVVALAVVFAAAFVVVAAFVAVV